MAHCCPGAWARRVRNWPKQTPRPRPTCGNAQLEPAPLTSRDHELFACFFAGFAFARAPSAAAPPERSTILVVEWPAHEIDQDHVAAVGLDELVADHGFLR